VQLVISDAHTGLRAAVEAILIGAAWQRCRVHFLRINVLAQVPKGSAEMVAAAIRTIFAQPDAAHVREQLDIIAGMLGRQLPKVETMLRDAGPDITAFADFPVPHWKKGLEHQPTRAAQQGNQTPHRRRGCVPQPGRAAAASRPGARRSTRRMASRRQALPLRGHPGPTRQAQRPISAKRCRSRRAHGIVTNHGASNETPA